MRVGRHQIGNRPHRRERHKRVQLKARQRQVQRELRAAQDELRDAAWSGISWLIVGVLAGWAFSMLLWRLL